MEYLLRYTALGLAYWAFCLLAFGTPAEVLRQPRTVRWRAHAATCAALVAAWPLAAVSDLVAWGGGAGRRG